MLFVGACSVRESRRESQVMGSSGKRAGRLLLVYVSVLVVMGLIAAAPLGYRTVISPGTTSPFSQPQGTSLNSETTVQSSPTLPPTTIPIGPIAGEQVLFGRSVNGEPLVYVRRGDPQGARILVIGSIHGDEDDGIPIVDHLLDLEVPEGLELWLVRSMNPDGNIAQTRQNANGVDLNRNFPENWAPLEELGDWQYSGPSAASEPETQAMVSLGEEIRPHLVLWYHQDYFRISPGRGVGGSIRRDYGQLTGLPILQVSGGTYTGTASQWSRSVTVQGGTGFTIELGPTLSDDEALTHAQAVLAVSEKYFVK